MTVYELNRDQLEELKQRYYMDHVNENPSYGELAEIDDLVSDEEVYEEYAGTDFVVDDFFSSAGLSSEYSLELGECLGDRNMIVAELRQIAKDIENGYYSGTASYGTNWSIM